MEGVIKTSDRIPEGNLTWTGANPDPASRLAPDRIYNIGSNQPVELMHLIDSLEKTLGKTANKPILPIQAGDVKAPYDEIDELVRDAGFRPRTSIEAGAERFVEWYREYHRL